LSRKSKTREKLSGKIKNCPKMGFSKKKDVFKHLSLSLEKNGIVKEL